MPTTPFHVTCAIYVTCATYTIYINLANWATAAKRVICMTIDIDNNENDIIINSTM